MTEVCAIEGTQVLKGPLALGEVASKTRAAWCKSCRFERDEIAEVGEGPMVGLCEGDTETRPLVHEDAPRLGRAEQM